MRCLRSCLQCVSRLRSFHCHPVRSRRERHLPFAARFAGNIGPRSNSPGTGAENKCSVMLRVILLSRLQNDQRPIHTIQQLCFVMPVSMINKRSRSRRSHARHEGCSRSNSWRRLLCRAGPARHTVVVTLQLNSMPVNRCRIAGSSPRSRLLPRV
jgi:hypothetical protein